MRVIKTGLLLLCGMSLSVGCRQKTDADYLKMALEADSLGQIQDALTYYDKSIEINPNNAIAFCKRGMLKQYSGEADPKYYDEAILDLNKAIDINPNYAEALFKRGTVYSNMKLMDKACEDWRQAVSMGYKDEANFLVLFCKDKGAAENLRKKQNESKELLVNFYFLIEKNKFQQASKLFGGEVNFEDGLSTLVGANKLFGKLDSFAITNSRIYGEEFAFSVNGFYKNKVAAEEISIMSVNDTLRDVGYHSKSKS